jgi:hypothetical protein
VSPNSINLLNSNRFRTGKSYEEIFGLERAVEIKEKQRLAAKARSPMSQTTRQLRSNIFKGRKINWGNKISQAKSGVRQSVEHRQNNIEIQKKIGQMKRAKRKEAEKDLPDSRGCIRYFEWKNAVRDRDGHIFKNVGLLLAVCMRIIFYLGISSRFSDLKFPME